MLSINRKCVRVDREKEYLVSTESASSLLSVNRRCFRGDREKECLASTKGVLGVTEVRGAYQQQQKTLQSVKPA